MMIIMFLILLIAFFLFVIAAYYSAVKEEQENQMIQSYMLSMEELYGLMEKKVQAVRCYRHDLKKHIQTLNYDHGDNEIYCQDEMINALLVLKAEQCKEKNVPFRIEVQEPVPKGDMEFISLLCNLLDNAMEANERIQREEDRFMRLYMECTNDEFRLQVMNHMEHGKQLNFHTDKQNADFHGLGMKIIRSMVDKKRGTLQVLHDQHNHTVTITVSWKMKGAA